MRKSQSIHQQAVDVQPVRVVIVGEGGDGVPVSQPWLASGNSKPGRRNLPSPGNFIREGSELFSDLRIDEEIANRASKTIANPIVTA